MNESSGSGSSSGGPDAVATEAPDSIKLLVSLARSAATLADDGESFAFLVDRVTGRLNLGLVLSAKTSAPTQSDRLERCLQLHPGMIGPLSRGEHALIPSRGANIEVHWNCLDLPNRIPCLLVMPIIHESSFEAVLCVEFYESFPTTEKIDLVRHLCRRAGPFVARVRDLEVVGGDPGEPQEPLSRPFAAAAMKSLLVSNVTHELRAPLVAMRGYIKTILGERAGPINETQGEYLGIVLENTNKLVNLINWAGKLLNKNEEDLTLTLFDFRELWTECTKPARIVATARNLTISERFPSGSFALVADREKLGKVLNSLFRHALKSADQSGTVEAELLRGRSGQVIFKISHTGKGLTPEMARMFERYESGEPSSEDDKKGENSVNDLSRVRDIVCLHGGTVSIAGKAGEGESFVFTIPVIEPSTAKSAAL